MIQVIFFDEEGHFFSSDLLLLLTCCLFFKKSLRRIMKKKVQLIGIENNTFRTLKEQLLTISDGWKKELDMIEIVEVDDIMLFNLKSVPAIAVNGKVIYQQNGQKVTTAHLATLIDAHL